MTNESPQNLPHTPDGLEEAGAAEVAAAVRDLMRERVSALRQGLRKLADRTEAGRS